jgi:C-terminal processing protease CtpA/Prc
VKTDWDAVLTDALRRAYTDKSVEEFEETLRWVVSQLHDGHGGVSQRSLLEARGRLPFRAEWIEGKAVVVASAEDGPLKRGDVIRSIDGVPAQTLIERDERLRSGSPQWRRAGAVRALGTGPKDTEARVVVERNGKEVELKLRRGRPGDGRSPDTVEARPANFAEVKPGIIYVDLSTAEMPDITSRMTSLASARGVIFDLRGYPKGNHEVLRHLTSTPIQSAIWQVPQIIYPDRKRVVGYSSNGRWNLLPNEPRLRGKVVFLTGPQAISYAESVMGIVEHYHLGTIVGETTAATNGNVNPLRLPGDFSVYWTGMRVLKHDGTQHHLVGIKPDVRVSRTIKGVREGRDEVLEKAIGIASK